MFTGIVVEIGKIVHAKRVGGSTRLTVAASKSSAELSVNDSVAINGCCQTVVEKKGETFSVVAVEETLKKTTLGELRENAPVNLELAMRLDDRLGGHLVLGHIDGVGTVSSIEKKASSWLFAIQVPQEFLHYLIPVGSVAVDGVSLTVAQLGKDRFAVSIIPHTFENTVFKYLKTGSRVNLEFDLIGKYVERLMAKPPGAASTDEITSSRLTGWGYS